MKKSTFSKQHKERLLQVHRRKAFTDDLVSLPGLMQQCKLTVKNMPTEKTFCNTDSILMLVCMQIREEKQYPFVRKTLLWNRVWTENVHKHINSLKTSRNLQLKVLEHEERTTVDPDIKHFAASQTQLACTLECSESQLDQLVLTLFC